MSKQQHYELGMKYFTEDRLDDAVQELERAVEIDPGFGDALHALAMAYYHKKDFDNAIRVGKSFADVEPKNTLAYTSLSMFYHAKGMIDEAEEMGAKAQSAALEEQAGQDSDD